METPNPYSGLIYCVDCGKILILSRAHTMDVSKNNFMCSTYKRFGKEECSSHYLRESQLAAVILDDLKRVTHFARQDEILFAECINRKNTTATRKEIATVQKDIDVMQKRDLSLTDFSRGFTKILYWGESPMSITEPCQRNTPPSRNCCVKIFQKQR